MDSTFKVDIIKCCLKNDFSDSIFYFGVNKQYLVLLFLDSIGLPVAQGFPPQDADSAENQNFDHTHDEAGFPPFGHVDVV